MHGLSHRAFAEKRGEAKGEMEREKFSRNAKVSMGINAESKWGMNFSLGVSSLGCTHKKLVRSVPWGGINSTKLRKDDGQQWLNGVRGEKSWARGGGKAGSVRG